MAHDLSYTCGVDIGVTVFSLTGHYTTFANCGRVTKNEKEIIEKLKHLKGRLEMVDQMKLKKMALLQESELLHEKIDEAKERLRILAVRLPTPYNTFLAKLTLVKIAKTWSRLRQIKEIVEKLKRSKRRLEMVDKMRLKRNALLEETELLYEKINEAKERLRILATRLRTPYIVFLARLHLVKIAKARFRFRQIKEEWQMALTFFERSMVSEEIIE